MERLFRNDRVWRKGIDYIFNAVELILCRYHFVDMLPEIRYMFDQDILDEGVMGKYNSCADNMFECRQYEERFCKTSMDAAGSLASYADFCRKIVVPKDTKK
ncbi:MAG: hypothetical protein NC341_07720 [Blautia sp.]|nr:hypothetical protein [Blautia sp.]MCM1201442.1 hypothetical protein [Bacteroides fragilis]